MFLKWFEKVRTEILLQEGRPEIVFDLNSSPGDSILDEATGRWAATVARKTRGDNDKMECIFIRLTRFEGEEKKIGALRRAICSWLEKGEHRIFYLAMLKSLRKLPRMPYSYWVPDSLAELFKKYPPLDRDNSYYSSSKKISDIKSGTHTSDDDRFTRYFWEVDVTSIGKRKKWAPFPKGGNAFYSDINLLVNWENNGKEIKEYPPASVRNESYNFRRGICWPDIVSSARMNFRILPEVVLSKVVQSLFPTKEEYVFPLLSYGNSLLAAFLLSSLDPLMHHRGIGYVAQLPVAISLLASNKLETLSKEAYALLREWDTGDETSTQFIKPWILQASTEFDSSEIPVTRHPLAQDFEWSKVEIFPKIREIRGSPDLSILDLAELCKKRETLLRKKLHSIQEQIDEVVYQLYDISKKDREIIEREMSFFGVKKESEDEGILPKISHVEHVARLLSYYVKKVIELDENGITSLESVVSKVRGGLAKDFGEDRSQKVESEISKILGKSLENWFANDFFEFHTSLFGRRPIIWQMTSANFSHGRGIRGIFNCFLHYHRLGRDTIPKIRTKREYLKGILDGAKWKTERLRRELQNARDLGDKSRERQLQREYEEAIDEFSELQAFDNKLAEVSNPRNDRTQLDEDASWMEKKIAEVRDDGWTPVIDYGVRVNIEPLKERKNISSTYPENLSSKAGSGITNSSVKKSREVSHEFSKKT